MSFGLETWDHNGNALHKFVPQATTVVGDVSLPQITSATMAYSSGSYQSSAWVNCDVVQVAAEMPNQYSVYSWKSWEHASGMHAALLDAQSGTLYYRANGFADVSDPGSLFVSPVPASSRVLVVAQSHSLSSNSGYGVSIRNDIGQMVVHDSLPSIQAVEDATQTVYIAPSGARSPSHKVSLTFTNEYIYPPILAISAELMPTNQNIMMLSWIKNAAGRFVGANLAVSNVSPSAWSMGYRIYSKLSDVYGYAPSGHGMVIYSQTGQPIFDAKYKPISITTGEWKWRVFDSYGWRYYQILGYYAPTNARWVVINSVHCQLRLPQPQHSAAFYGVSADSSGYWRSKIDYPGANYVNDFFPIGWEVFSADSDTRGWDAMEFKYNIGNPSALDLAYTNPIPRFAKIGYIID